ncbi:hypothetical protein ONZ45_g7895 [Pleurotus djamor]|nr:hypothetical protein ONZ45_g18202 [Pleurotus djamor]KAJ8514581.1 hypothetical protein ONZ45_g7895 [Pleurotus djamor]
MIVDARASLMEQKLLDMNDGGKPIDPPPYTDSDRVIPPRPPPRPPVRAPGSSSSQHSPHTESVNGLFLAKRKEAITGRYRLDPCLPISDTHHPPKGYTEIPNACFATHQGDINVEISTACNHSEQARAVACLASRTGNITVLLAESAASQTIKLDLTSRRGTVALFVPRAFCGVIKLYTRKGSMEVMPALLKISKIVNESDNEILLMVGSSTSTSSSVVPYADFCQLHSRLGQIYVGVRGEDKLLPREPGVWQKLATYFGRHDNASTRTLSSSGS